MKTRRIITMLGNKNTRKCALCVHWNGAMGSTTIKALYGGKFEFDNNEKQSCFKKGITTSAVGTCPNFEPRYK